MKLVIFVFFDCHVDS